MCGGQTGRQPSTLYREQHKAMKKKPHSKQIKPHQISQIFRGGWHEMLNKGQHRPDCPVETSLQRVLRVTEQVSLWDGGAGFSWQVAAGLEAGDDAGIVPPLTPRSRRGVGVGAWWKSCKTFTSKTVLVDQLWYATLWGTSPALYYCCTWKKQADLRRVIPVILKVLRNKHVSTFRLNCIIV